MTVDTNFKTEDYLRGCNDMRQQILELMQWMHERQGDLEIEVNDEFVVKFEYYLKNI